MGYYGRGYGMMGGSWAVDLFWIVLALAIIVGLIVLVIYVARQMSHAEKRWDQTVPAPPPAAPDAQTAPPEDEAHQIARKRYAAGEITKEQYEEMSKTLKG